MNILCVSSDISDKFRQYSQKKINQPEDKFMWFKCITCEVLARIVYACAASSLHVIDVELVQRGLHNQPGNLQKHLQTLIDSADQKKYDAVLLSYGLCGQATAGLTARTRPLVIPRAHDCITLFLGSRKRYTAQFNKHPGTYWYAQDYIERDDGSGTSLALGSGLDTNVHTQYQEFIEKYGQENADYLMEVMGAWQQHYQRAAFIDMGVSDGYLVEQQAQQESIRRGWIFEKIAGDISLVKKLLEGRWEDDYLVVPPGQSVVMTYDENVIGCKP
jgi:hypothetical protein